jgi:hypothetical protein
VSHQYFGSLTTLAHICRLGFVGYIASSSTLHTAFQDESGMLWMNYHRASMRRTSARWAKSTK